MFLAIAFMIIGLVMVLLILALAYNYVITDVSRQLGARIVIFLGGILFFNGAYLALANAFNLPVLGLCLRSI